MSIENIFHAALQLESAVIKKYGDDGIDRICPSDREELILKINVLLVKGGDWGALFLGSSSTETLFAMHRCIEALK